MLRFVAKTLRFSQVVSVHELMVSFVELVFPDVRTSPEKGGGFVFSSH